MKSFTLMCLLLTFGIILYSCVEQNDEYYIETQTTIEKKTQLVKIYFVDGTVEIYQYEFVWSAGDGVTARLQIDGDKKDVYIKLIDVKRYEKYIGLSSEVTQ